MVKCRLQIKETDCCQNCCCFCEEKDTCKDVCGDMTNPCDEMIEFNDLQVMQDNVPDVIHRITELSVMKKKIEAEEKQMKEMLVEAMEQNGIKSFENDEVKFVYVAPTTRTSLDSTKLKKDHPDLVKEYQKTSKVSASVRISVK